LQLIEQAKQWLKYQHRFIGAGFAVPWHNAQRAIRFAGFFASRHLKVLNK
jgi:hypothetical protein